MNLKNINDIYKILNNSSTTLIGYSFREEKILNKVISDIPHYKIENVKSFSIKSFSRDIKLSTVLGNDEKPRSIEYLILDLNDNLIPRSSNIRSNAIFNIVNNIKESLTNTNIKLIVTVSVNRNLNKSSSFPISISSRIIMNLDSVVIIKNNSDMEVIKSRYY